MSNNDDLTSTLNRELEERAHAMDGSTLHLADVQGRARSIRRRRTAGAIAGAAAAVALIVPTAMLATHSNGRPEPGPAITQTPSPSEPTQTASPTGHQPAPGVLDVRDLPTGAPPAIEYVQDGKLYLPGTPDGSEVGTRHPAQQVVEMADGARAWLTTDQGKFFIEIQDADGSFRDPVPSSFTLGVNEDHNVATWLDRSGQVFIWENQAGDPRPYGDPLPASSEPKIAGITGSRCDLACTVYVNTSGPNGFQPYEVTDQGTSKLVDGSFKIVDGVSGSGLFAGRTEVTDGASCSKVLGGGDFPGWGTCKYQAVAFSPDDSLIAAFPPYVDGPGSSSLAVLEATGGTVFDRQSNPKSQVTVADLSWEDATHLLAATYQEGQWSLVRFNPDGTMEYAVPPAAGNDVGQSPFVLPHHPLQAS
jgi:hypothetical protein